MQDFARNSRGSCKTDPSLLSCAQKTFGFSVSFLGLSRNRGRSYWGTNDPSGGRVARVVADRRDTQEFAKSVDEATRRLGGRWDLVVDFCAFEGKDIRTSLKGAFFIHILQVHRVGQLVCYSNWVGQEFK